MSDDVTREIARQLADLRERLARLEGSEYVAKAGILGNSYASVTAGGAATFQTLTAGYWALLDSGRPTGSTFTFEVVNPNSSNARYYEIIIAYRHAAGGYLNAWRYGLWVHDTYSTGDALVTTELTQATFGTDQDASFAMVGTTVTCTLPGDPDSIAVWALFGFTSSIN